MFDSLGASCNPLSFSHFSAKTLSVCRVIFWTPARIRVLFVLKSRKLSSRKCHIQNHLLIVHKWCIGCFLPVLAQLSLAYLWNVLLAPGEIHKSDIICVSNQPVQCSRIISVLCFSGLINRKERALRTLVAGTWCLFITYFFPVEYQCVFEE